MKRQKTAKELEREIELRNMVIRGQVLDVGAREQSWTMPVPDKVWSTNERTHYRVRSERTKAWRTMSNFQAQALGARIGVFPLVGKWDVEMTLPFTRNSRRDMSNYVGTVVKAVVDGLVDAGVWPDDDYRHVRVIEPSFMIQKPQATAGIWIRRIE